MFVLSTNDKRKMSECKGTQMNFLTSFENTKYHVDLTHNNLVYVKWLYPICYLFLYLHLLLSFAKAEIIYILPAKRKKRKDI